MKKLTLALAGASVTLTALVATPASAADFGRHDRGRYEQVQTRQVINNRFVTYNRFQRDNRFQQHRWNRGERFDRRYATNYMVVSNPYATACTRRLAATAGCGRGTTRCWLRSPAASSAHSSPTRFKRNANEGSGAERSRSFRICITCS